jgi:hypothetical protein
MLQKVFKYIFYDAFVTATSVYRITDQMDTDTALEGMNTNKTR